MQRHMARNQAMNDAMQAAAQQVRLAVVACRRWVPLRAEELPVVAGCTASAPCSPLESPAQPPPRRLPRVQAVAAVGLQPGDEVRCLLHGLTYRLSSSIRHSLGNTSACSASPFAALTATARCPPQVRMRLVYDGRGRGPRIEYVGRTGARAGRAGGAAAGAAVPSKAEGAAVEPPPQVGMLAAWLAVAGVGCSRWIWGRFV